MNDVNAADYDDYGGGADVWPGLPYREQVPASQPANQPSQQPTMNDHGAMSSDTDMTIEHKYNSNNNNNE